MWIQLPAASDQTPCFRVEVTGRQHTLSAAGGSMASFKRPLSPTAVIAGLVPVLSGLAVMAFRQIRCTPETSLPGLMFSPGR